MKFRLSRRQLGLVLPTAAAGCVLAYLFRPGDDEIVDLDLPPSAGAEDFSFAVFGGLCRIVLARTALDEAIMRDTYRVLMDEPWGPHHIASSYRSLRHLLTASALRSRTGAAAAMPQLSAGERWFVNHLATTWYLGIYYHEKRPAQRVAYDGALMYDAVRGLLPKPFAESLGYGRWSEAPREGASR